MRAFTCILDINGIRENPRAIEIIFAVNKLKKAIVYEFVNQANQC